MLATSHLTNQVTRPPPAPNSQAPPPSQVHGTDAALSLAAAEFVWNQAGFTHVHHLIFPAVLQWLREAGAQTVLDLGCGNGALTGALAARGFDVQGLDASESGLAIARRQYPGIPFLSADLSAPLPATVLGRFDAVIAVEVIEHLLLPRQLVARAREALGPSGILILSTPYHGYLKNLAIAATGQWDRHCHPLRDYGHVKFFSRATLTRLCTEQGWTVTRFRRVGRIPVLAKSMILQARPTTTDDPP